MLNPTDLLDYGMTGLVALTMLVCLGYSKWVTDRAFGLLERFIGKAENSDKKGTK